MTQQHKEEDSELTKMKLCLLCKDSNEYPYPKDGHGPFIMHFKRGVRWKPVRGHPQYELHEKYIKLLNLSTN